MNAPLLDRPSTPEDLEAERDQPRPGVWAGEPGADLRRLTQDETDALIRAEIVDAAAAEERADLERAVGAVRPLSLIGAARLQMAIRQRGGIDSDPLVRVLARRAWGDRDRAWFELRGVRKGDEVEIVPIIPSPAGLLVTVANTWRTTSWPPGIARADARPGDTVDVEWQMFNEASGDASVIVRKHRVGDRLREPPSR